MTHRRDSAQESHAALRINRLKSMFIGLYPVVALAICVYSAGRILSSGDVMGWSGPLATTLPVLAFLGVLMLSQSVARTSARLGLLLGIALVGLLASGYAVAYRDSDIAALQLAALGAGSLALYSLWYSRLGRSPSSRLIVGRPLAAFALKRVDGGTFTSSELLGRPSLLIFYRGNWCPLCVAQVKEIAGRYREIAEAGTRVLLVSPQPQRKTQALSRRFDVPFEFFVDEGNAAARQLGIEMPSGLPMGLQLFGYETDTVLPTVIVSDSRGIVRWLDQTDNYRVRPDPSVFIPVIRQIADEKAPV